jgi:hypothetical protein
MMTGKATETLKREVRRTLQNTNICGDFKNNVCKRTSCNRRHVKLDTQPLECPICCEQIDTESFGAALCGHMFCYNCVTCIDGYVNREGLITVQCPMCRTQSIYKKLM